MKTIKEDAFIEIEIKKSKFLSYACKVTNEDDVKKRLKELQELHKSATHVTYAYVLHSPSLEKCSDNGEPSGTAGKPILDVIKKNDLVNILIVVVRYFGGIKLGAGGLVRAYSGSAKEVLDVCIIAELKMYVNLRIKVSIDNKYLIDNNGNIKILNIDYSNIGDKIIVYDILVEDESGVMQTIESISKSIEIKSKQIL